MALIGTTIHDERRGLRGPRFSVADHCALLFEAAGGASSERNKRRSEMTLCPIAIVAGCKKCPAFSACPLKGVIGDYKPAEATPAQQAKGVPPKV
jgi:hypothetical protein